MPKIGWPALLGLGALFLIISALVGGEGNQGVLGQLASAGIEQEPQAAEKSPAQDSPPALAEMSDEVAPEMGDEDFGEPVAEDAFFDDFSDLSDGSDDEWAEVSESTVAARSRQQNSARPGTSARPAGRESAGIPLTGNDALMRDLQNSRLFEKPPAPGR